MSDSYAASADHPLDDIESVRVDLAECVWAIIQLDMPGEVRDALNERLPWSLRDSRAPR